MRNRTSQLIQFQNRISHYNHINFAKSTIKNSLDIQNKMNSRLSNKFRHSIQRQRKIQNQKLLDKLIQIHKKQPTNPSLRYFDNFEEKSLPIRSNKFRLQQKVKQRTKQNYLLISKLKNVKPLIGTKQQWSQHYDNFLQNQKKLSKLFSLRTSINENGFSENFNNRVFRESLNRIKLNTESTQQHLKLTKSISQKNTQKQSKQSIQREKELDIEKQVAPLNKHKRLRKKKKKHDKQPSNTICTQDIIKSLKKNRNDQQSQTFLELYDS